MRLLESRSKIFSDKHLSAIFFGTSLSLLLPPCPSPVASPYVPPCPRKEDSFPNCTTCPLQSLGQVACDSSPGLCAPADARNTAPFCSSALALGACLAAVISEAQHQGPLLSLMPVWVDLRTDLHMNGHRWEKWVGIQASFVPVTTRSAIKEHAKALMKQRRVLFPCCWSKPKGMGAWCLVLFQPGSPSKWQLFCSYTVVQKQWKWPQQPVRSFHLGIFWPTKAAKHNYGVPKPNINKGTVSIWGTSFRGWLKNKIQKHQWECFVAFSMFCISPWSPGVAMCCAKSVHDFRAPCSSNAQGNLEYLGV